MQTSHLKYFDHQMYFLSEIFNKNEEKVLTNSKNMVKH